MHTYVCNECKKEFSSRKCHRLFCSRMCGNRHVVRVKNKTAYDLYIRRWKQGLENGGKGVSSISGHVRKYLFEKYKSKCSKCEWSEVNIYTGKVPLQIEHKDGNWKNNREENLELLCPNCHTLTEFYGSRNKGRGRPTRVMRIA